MQGARTRRTVVLILVLALVVAATVTTLLLWVRSAQDAPAQELPIQPIQGSRIGTTILGADGWQVRSSADTKDRPSQISSAAHVDKGWLVVKPDDAGAPGTLIGALVQNKECPNVFYSQNMRDCFGYVTAPGPVEAPRFAVPWWYRTDFDIGPGLAPGQRAQIEIPGVMGEADVWLNGKEIATREVVSGAYAKHVLDVTELLRPGKNSFALMLYPNDPAGMFTTSSADWSQIPPDNNTGVQYPISLRVTGALGQTNTHVMQKNAPDLSRSELTVKTRVLKHGDQPQHGEVHAKITPPDGGPPVELRTSVDLLADQNFKDVVFDPTTIQHPKVWWPYSMGDQPLYTLDVTVVQNGVTTDSYQESFGIRTVQSRLVGEATETPGGWRQFSVNGKDVLIRGGESAPDLFLRYSKAQTARLVAMVRNMGLNAVRLEGHDEPDDFYQQMDKAGILVLGGFMCCNAWQPPSDSILTDRDERIIYESSRSIGERERDHPSVISYGWSDNEPTPKQERATLRGFNEADFDVPVIAAAMYKNTPTLEWSGEREGPYDWVPPSFWYEDGHSGPANETLTNISGSRGFGSEQGAGDSIPTLASLKRFLSPEELDKLWRDPNYNQYHTNFQPARGGKNLHGPATGDGYAFGTLYNFSTALAHRYGPWSDLESYVQLAQLANYESVRAQFEAFIRYSTDPVNPSTGLVYFMINQGWPSLLWNLYGSDGDQPGSYFGAAEANRPVHALLSYDDNTVTVANFGIGSQDHLMVQTKVVGVDGKVLDDQTAPVGPLASQEVRNGLLSPNVPAEGPAYFVEVLLKRGDDVVDRNVYWRSTVAELVDWDANGGNRVNFPNAPMRQYADFTALRSLPPAQVAVTVGAPTAGKVSVRLTNSSDSVAFFLRADAPAAQSVMWDQNDITLLPGETQTITATYDAPPGNSGKPQITVSGVNMAEVTVK
ncbi:glycoside hydrolase family 2 sugar binding protein [Segniliparus rotundus DSM 44985]|uniref:Glycoside hydrolase family 2 sugar binding protein n=1 Tax=Segniliparus rotundus (strain ATCC BAA-972 / CDC 1076 / CIP 108378 / DSM 44985 / JCM 13578) TaxID=640132 RepID=D6ZDU2_SEGRD|nr:beta-mannosidase [Segniliparus rotundus]ADG99349.1 glycoside hydrolase family 2 sugar binding protein [Segniliparus rotundus DSM 44985]